MPLWLQGAVEFFVAAFILFLGVAVLIGAVVAAKGFDGEQSIVSVGMMASNIWLLMHGVPLNLNIPVNGVFEAVTGTMSLTPLGLVLIPLGLSYKAGHRLAQASYEGQFWQPLAAGLVSYGALAGLASLWGATAQMSTPLLQAVMMPLAVVVCGALLGGYRESRSLARMIGVNAATWVTRFSQYSRWAGSYAWAVVRSALVSTLVFIAGGAVLAAISLFYNWNDVVATYQTLHAGVIGDLAVTLLQFGFLLNFLIYAMAWSTGAGFMLGEGTRIDLTGTDVGVMPALPMLSALPAPIQPWSFFALIVPMVAGAVAGWWFFREGENHFDEWLSLKVRFRWISWPLSTLFLALCIGALAGVAALLLGLLAQGSLGLGRLTQIGADPLIFGVYTAGLIALGTVVGSIFAPLIEPDNSTELERFAQSKRSAQGDKPQKKRPSFFKLPALKPVRKKAETADSSVTLEPVSDEVTPKNEALARLFADNDIISRQSPEQELRRDTVENPQLELLAPDTSEEHEKGNLAETDEEPFDSQQREESEDKPEAEVTKPKKRLVIRRPKAKKNHRS